MAHGGWWTTKHAKQHPGTVFRSLPAARCLQSFCLSWATGAAGRHVLAAGLRPAWPGGMPVAPCDTPTVRFTAVLHKRESKVMARRAHLDGMLHRTMTLVR